MRKVLVAIVVMGVVAGAIVGGGLLVKTKGESAARFLTDGASIHVAAGEASKRRVLWTPPEALAEGVNSSEDEYEPFLSFDAQTMLFVRGKAGGGADILTSTRTLEGWTDPEPISVNTVDFDELGPALSRDGQTIYFYSDRPGGLGGYDIWAADREGEAWGEARNLGTAVNSVFNDYGPTLNPEGSRLLFASNRPTAEELEGIDEDAWAATLREDVYSADYDLYRSNISDRGLGDAVAIEELNTGAHDGSPAFSPAGDFLYFASKREGGFGGYDLYRVRLAADGEIALDSHAIENLGASVNSASNEMDPVLSQLGFELHFSSDRLRSLAESAGEGSYDLFVSTSREVYETVEVPEVDWAGLWSLVWPNLVWLLLLGLLLLLLLLAIRHKPVQDRYRRLGLLGKCLLVSMLVHLLLLSVIGAYRLGSVLGEVRDRSGASRVALLSREGASDVARQVRGSLTQVEVRQVSFEALATPMELPRLELAREIREFALDQSQASDRQMELAEAEDAEAREAELELLEESREVELAEATPEAMTPDAPTPEAPEDEAQSEVSQADMLARRSANDVALDAELAAPAAVEVAQSDQAMDDGVFEPATNADAEPLDLETPEPAATLSEQLAEADVDGPSEAVVSDIQTEREMEVAQARPDEIRSDAEVVMDTALPAPSEVEIEASDAVVENPTSLAERLAGEDARAVETGIEPAAGVELAELAAVDAPEVDSNRMDVVQGEVVTELLVDIADRAPSAMRNESESAVDAAIPSARQAEITPDRELAAIKKLAIASPVEGAVEAGSAHLEVEPTVDAEVSPVSIADAPEIDSAGFEIQRSEVEPERFVEVAAQVPSAMRQESAEPVLPGGASVESAELSPEFASRTIDAMASSRARAVDAGTPNVEVDPTANARVVPLALGDAPKIDSGSLELQRTEIEAERLLVVAAEAPSAVRVESAEPMSVGTPSVESVELLPEFDTPAIDALALPAMSGEVRDAEPDTSVATSIQETEFAALSGPEVSVGGLETRILEEAGEASFEVDGAVVASEAPRASSRVEFAQGMVAEPVFGEFDVRSVEISTGSVAVEQVVKDSAGGAPIAIELSRDLLVPDVGEFGSEIAISDETLSFAGDLDAAVESEARLSVVDAVVIESEPGRAPEGMIEVAADTVPSPIVGDGVERTRDVELVPLADVAIFDGDESLSLPALSEVGLGVDAPVRIVEDASLTLDVPSELAAVPRAYRQRSEEFREELIEDLGGSVETELGVEAALAWLANHQDLTGRWSGIDFDDACRECVGESRLEFDAAVTGLSTLAFLGADHTHLRAGPYRDTMRRAMDWITRSQDDAGDLSQGSGIYAHAIATTALAEMLAMTGDPSLVEAVQAAATFIAERIEGDPSAWQSEVGAIGDTSAMGWQVMALVSARRAGADVPDRVFDAARDWIDTLSFPTDPGVYSHAPGEDPTRWATAEAMFSHRLLGRNRDDDRMRRSAEVIGSIDPDWEGEESTFQWYATTMALYQHQGRIWNTWNEELIGELLDHQESDGHESGSWAGRDRNSLIGGRVYQTAMNTLLLEVYYRYLPGFMDLDAADTGVVRGRVFDGRTGKALIGALVRLDLPDRPPQIVVTGDRGRYTLRPEDVPDHVAITATMEGYLPASVDVPTERLLRGVVERDIELFPQVAGVLALEAQPEVHHLGNNEFSGRVNSQFQREAEGLEYERVFVLDRGLLRMAHDVAEVRLLHRGTQAPNPVRINGHRLSQRLIDSPRDGSFGEWRATFPARWLQEGENVLQIRSVRGNSDLDDFEFVNVRIVLDPGDENDRR